MRALVGAVQPRTAHGIATTVSRLIEDDVLPPGTKLPAVRSLAGELHVSATTVSDAWRVLVRSGLIRTAGRHGTYVTGRGAVVLPPRTWRSTFDVAGCELDLSTGVPDTRLLPDLRRALGTLSQTATVVNYHEPTVVPSLEEAVRAGWQGVFRPQSVVMVDGALDGIDRVFRECLGVGDRVLVENPSLPAIFDVIESHGGVPVPMEMDEQGIRPEALIGALKARPVALVLQPRAHNPTGISMSWERAEHLAALLRDTDVTVIEDDHSGDIAFAPMVSLAHWRPERTVHVKSFSKSHGPDLRLAAVGGPRGLLEHVELRRRLGPVWSSHILQLVLLELLRDPVTSAAVADARRTYQARRRHLQTAVEELGLTTTGADGFNLWVTVADERAAVRHLHERGVGVCPGAPFLFEPDGEEHVRVTCASIESDVARIATLVAEAGHVAVASRGAVGRHCRPTRDGAAL